VTSPPAADRTCDPAEHQPHRATDSAHGHASDRPQKAARALSYCFRILSRARRRSLARMTALRLRERELTFRSFVRGHSRLLLASSPPGHVHFAVPDMAFARIDSFL